MKLPTSLKDLIFDTSGVISAVDLYTYLTSHVRHVNYDRETLRPDSYPEVPVETLDSAPRVWDGSLTGTATRSSTLGYAAAQRGDLFISPLTVDGWTFPVDPLIGVSVSKTVVQTQLGDGRIPVIEEVAHNGFDVSIRGVLINEDNDDYPYDQVAQLNNLINKRGGLVVQNNILNRCYGIERIVIRNASLPGEEGMQSMQAFTISAVSDRDVQLEIREGWS